MAMLSEYQELNLTFSQLNQLNRDYALTILRTLSFAQENTANGTDDTPKIKSQKKSLDDVV